jgi:hypothetical protein
MGEAVVPATLPPPGPVFLAGIDRSGIGLLGELLERHPRIAMTRRTDFWSRYRGRYGDLRVVANVDRCLQAIAADRRGRVFEPDRDRLLAELAHGPSYPRLFELLQQQRLEQLGRARWGDKSLGTERYARLVLRAFPTARMIHVVRDPRDRYASQKYHRQGGKGGVAAGAAQWRWSVRLAERNTRRYPDRYLVVRYESLVSDPERILRTVCAFIGEPYPVGLVDELAPEGQTSMEGDRAPGPIHTRSVGTFRTRLTPREVLTLQLVAGHRLSRYGYVREPVRLARAARWRFTLAQLPLDAVSAVLWGPWTRLCKLVARPSPR